MTNENTTEPRFRWRKSLNDIAPVRLMGRVEGYVMVRYKGCAPFIMREKDWLKLPVSEPLGESANEE